MRISPAGLQLIKSFEGFRETAVRLPDGRWTIGYGHVRSAREGVTITPKDADELLLHDLKSIENAVSNMIYAPLMQGQFDALVSLAFNISLGQLRDSDIVRLLNSGDYLGAANAFDLWRKARLHGRVIVVDALVRRRAAEKALFLQHPSGPPSAPTPMVTPEMDYGAEPPTRPRANLTPPQANDDDEPEAPRSGPAPTGEIADAVRRLAEKTQNAIWPSIEIPLPPGANVAPPEELANDAPVEEAPPMAYEATTETTTVVEEMPEPVAPQPAPRDPEPPVTAEDLARASRTVADRVSNILSGLQRKIDSHEASSAQQAEAKDAASPMTQRVVREGLPDFDEPAEKTRGADTPRDRALIDDLEIIEPGRDPKHLFAEAERKAKVVNGHAKRVGPISGRVMMLAPWIFVLVLSVLGFGIGAVEAMKTEGLEAGSQRMAGTILAVFGIMMVMSVYYIFWKRHSDET
jgi:lysozyme